jgi:ABC-type multidrug transport system ATPase subunit
LDDAAAAASPAPDPAPKPPALEVTDVFQHVAGHAVLKGVSLTLQQGEGVLLIGRNGAGKSLLMRLVLGLDLPSAGQVRLFGQELRHLAGSHARALRRRVGAVLQRGSLLDGLTVLENLLLSLQPTRMSGAEMARAARLAMTQLQLDGMENHLPRALSVGQRRRVELARALIHRPDLLIWDGLTDGLDLPAVREILELLRSQMRLRGLTIIGTDNIALDAVAPEDRVVVLERGQVIFDGSRAALEAATPERLELRYLLHGRW